MDRVIYADVLVIINVYITYFLLKSSALLAKENSDRLRLLLSSFLGGAYSLTVLLPEKVQQLIGIIRIGVIFLFILVAFGYRSLKSFFRLGLSFLFCSFIFAGLMLALWYFICPKGMYFNGSVVYFDINILTLAVLTVVCYAFLKLFDRFFKSRAPVNTVFYCTVKYEGRDYSLKAFLDTGNRLTDYFTSRPVIVAERGAFSDAFPDKIAMDEEMHGGRLRLLFCKTLTGDDFLPAFSPEKVHIKGTEYEFTTDEVTVALTEKKLLHGEYDAILPMPLFDNYRRKDEIQNEQTALTF